MSVKNEISVLSKVLAEWSCLHFTLTKLHRHQKGSLCDDRQSTGRAVTFGAVTNLGMEGRKEEMRTWLDDLLCWSLKEKGNDKTREMTRSGALISFCGSSDLTLAARVQFLGTQV